MPTEPPAPTRRPRYRYLLFRVRSPGALSRNEFVQALRRAGGGDRAWLTRFDGRHGILRCPRGKETEMRRFLEEQLPSTGVEVETLSTSGTIAALERRHRDLDLGGRG
jgi:RNase P/RNase MRP subunit POP5